MNEKIFDITDEVFSKYKINHVIGVDKPSLIDRLLKRNLKPVIVEVDGFMNATTMQETPFPKEIRDLKRIKIRVPYGNPGVMFHVGRKKNLLLVTTDYGNSVFIFMEPSDLQH